MYIYIYVYIYIHYTGVNCHVVFHQWFLFGKMIGPGSSR